MATEERPPSLGGADQRRVALIYVPGSDTVASNQSLETISRLIATELDRNAANPRTAFPIQIGARPENFGAKLRTYISTIARRDGSLPQPVLDLYVLDYHDTIRAPYINSPLPFQSLRVLSSILLHLPNLLSAIFGRRGRAKTGAQWLQVLLGLTIFAFMSAYMVVMLIAVYDTVIQLPQLQRFSHLMPKPLSAPSGAGDEPSSATADQSTLTGAQALTVLSAALGLFFPQFRAGLARAAISTLAVVYYLRLGERRNVLTGHLTALVQHLAEKEGPEYSRIDIIAYSFGSIIALDALFPAGRDPSRRYAMIDTLVTIGCPFDVIRAFWRHYFTDRHTVAGVPRRWLNVYSPFDILSSSFREDTLPGDALVSIGSPDSRRPENLLYSDTPYGDTPSVADIITLMGIRAHSSMYWERDFESESSCFSLIIPALYSAEPFLAG